MHRKYANNVLVVLVFALSVASIILTYTLFAFVKNVQFETVVMKKNYSRAGGGNGGRVVHYSGGVPGAEDEWSYERGFGFDGAGHTGANKLPTTGRSRSRSTTKSTVCSTPTGSSQTALESDSRITSTV
ncbi:hypothetical protein EDB86DRAFT_2830608 [Lactarius hatsudake]|nr:hypothetical protein EDB86DRAFT_2830608 [Lactarius hatsudake]